MLIGQTLSHYRITAALGAGGMGEVYRATDTTLNREVAVKVLPSDVARDSARLARFRREAQLLAALNHPNIAAIHGLEEVENTPFLVLELVEGKDLAERLKRGPLPVGEALAIGRQIAEALEEAHEKGVVHRDLKPANVKLTPDDQAKVLDFGLAKAWTVDPDPGSSPDLSESPTLAHVGTEAGVILGTAAYMSPEQARGKPVDRRADIWAFGVVVYEMLAGRQLFEGETVSDVLAAVLTREPDWDALPQDVPPGVRQLLHRCLTRDPKQRLRDVGEARITLTPPFVDAAAEPVATGPPRRTGRVAAMALLALAAAFAAGYALRPAPDAPPPRIDPDAIVRQLTFEPGLEAEPSFSPDSHYLAYTTNHQGSLDIAVLPLAGGPLRWLAASEADEAHPAWSPDGTQIAFTSARDHGGRLSGIGGLSALSVFVYGQGGDIFLAPASGGREVRLVERGSSPAWSPDGRAIAFQSDRGGDWDIWIVPAQGGEPRALTNDPTINYQPAWSPDSRWIAYASVDGLRVVPSDGSGAPRQLTGSGRGVLAPAWSPDGRWIYYASSHHYSEGSTSLWRMEFPPRNDDAPFVQRITLGETADVDPALAASGHRLAYGKVRYSPDLVELDVASGEQRQITFASSLDDYPHLSSDGETLVFFSDRGARTGIWTIRLDGSGLEPVTAPDLTTTMPRWSPDGRLIAFTRRSEADNAITVQPIDGLASRDLDSSDGSSALQGAAWSPDGETLAYSRSEPDGTSAIWVVDLEGTKRKVAAPQGVNMFPTWSPDGRSVTFQSEGEGPRQIWVAPVEGGETRPVSSAALEHSHPQWSPVDPDRILVVIDHKNLAVLSVATGRLEFLTDFDDSTIVVDYPSWSPDATKIYFSLTRKIGDLFLVETGGASAE